MIKVLLVYELVPEETNLYALEVSSDELAWLKKCHRNFINTEMSKEAEKACDRLSVYLESKTKLKDKEPVDLSGYDWLIVSGFVM